MARPKKIDVATGATVEAVVTDPSTPTEPIVDVNAELDQKAVSIVKISPTEFKVVLLKYNLNTGVGKVVLVENATFKQQAMDKFKLMTIREGLF